MSTPKISLCCITGNEEPAVIGFLDSFAGAFDELCLVRAVGSVTPDRTLSLAKEWCRKNGKKCALGIYENALGETRDWPHVDDFAAARNQAWSMATGDWQLWADLDDLLVPAGKDAPGGAELIRLCAGADTHDFFFFTYDLRGQNEKNVRERMFRTGIARWVNPLHETLREIPLANGETQRRALIEERVVYEHAPKAEKARDPMRNRRIMQHHTRFLNAYAFELHREFYYEWQATKKDEAKEQATKWAELSHQTDCLPEQRYDLFLHQAHIAAEKDVEHALDLCWQAIRVNPKCRDAWGDLAEYEMRLGRGPRAAVATGFMQSIPKAPTCGYPQSTRYFGFHGAHLRARSLRAAGKDEAAKQTEDVLFEKHGKRISLLHATRGRPAQALAAREAFFRAANVPLGVEHIFAIDADDDVSLRELAHFRHVVVKDPRGCVKAWNEAAAVSSGHVLVQLSDDWLPCYNWDDLVWEAMTAATSQRLNITPINEGERATIESAAVGSYPLVLAIHDGHRTDALLCMAILTRARYEQQGREMFSAEYFGVFSDNEFTVRAYNDGVVVQAQHIVFEHRHPIFAGKPVEQWDETHRRQNAPERYSEGLAIFQRRNPTQTPKTEAT
jgi:hypothetical protein